jgi:hypothetical protein
LDESSSHLSVNPQNLPLLKNIPNCTRNFGFPKIASILERRDKLGYGAVSDLTRGNSWIFHDASFTKSWYLQGFVKT